jgi:predicted phage terminase large subunit-like protein
MSEPIWTIDYLLNEGKAEAAKAGDQLSIKHFWKVADRDLAGPAPKTFDELVIRAKNYITFDMVMAAYGEAGSNENIDSSIRRLEILGLKHKGKDSSGKDLWVDQKKCPSSTSTTDFLRFMCRTNLLFLGREIFNKDFTFLTHAPVCNFFVQKDPSKKIEEQDETKERLLLYPRGSFKSTINVVDCVQWFINLPNIRILILTAESGLAVAFIGELKNYFLVPDNADGTIFQKLFPEWNLTRKNEGIEDEFICPCRTVGDEKKRDPSAWASSILSNLPGWHCDLMKGDDVVNDKNTDTSMLVVKVIRKINYAESLVDPGGYKDLLGTPYAPGDLYAHTVESVLHPGDLKVLITPARWLRPEMIHKDERDCTPADYELLFEKDKTGRVKLDHKFLDRKKKKDIAVYLSQYMLSTAGTRKIKFTVDLMLQRTVGLNAIPHQLQYYIIWDFAYAVNQKNDYSVGAVVGLDIENRVYVVEIFRDHYLDNDLAKEIASSFQKYHPRLVLIENSNGAQFLERSIRQYALEAGTEYIPLDFFKVDRSPNAKASRVGALQPLLYGGQLFFLNTISCLEDLYKEFKDFGTSLHDDIPDTISHIHRIIPTGTTEPGGPGGRDRQKEFDRILREKDFYDLIFGQGDYAPGTNELPIVPEPGTGDTAGEELYDPYTPIGFKR